MNKPGPLVRRDKLKPLGKYLDDALSLANMSQSDLARALNHSSSSFVSRVMKGERTPPERDDLLSWCRLLNAPEWLEEKILQAALYASEQDRKQVESEDTIEQTHRTVLDELRRRKEQETEQEGQ